METHQRNPKKRDRDEEEDNGFPRKKDFPPPPPAGDGNLKVKLRIDKNPRAGREEDSPEKKDHVCVECNKRFSSGKALGGHMSSAHVQANRDYSYRKKKQVVRAGGSGKGSDEDGGGATEEEESEEGRREYYRDKDGQISCPHCFKKFPSRKSLFGHMRCHPDRYWRGMEPPPLHHQTLTISDNNNKSVEEDEDDEEDEEEDEKDEKEISPEIVIDLQGYLSTWASRAKRGRSPIKRRISSSSSGDDSDEELQEAVHHLVCLGNAQNPNPEINTGLMGKGKERLSDNEDDDSEDHGMLTKWTNPKNIDCPNENASVPAPPNNNNNKKRRILLMESEAESTKEGSSDDYSDQNIKLFKCSTCNKSFSSHQALGGHRSSHNKFKLSVQNTIDDCTNASASSAPLKNPQSSPQTVPNPHETAANATSKYQCSVCNKVFATGKALGGHKKCHSTPQPMQPAPPNSPERSPTPNDDEDDEEPKHLDFDLNEMPNDG